ncbi:SURP and G-patch domain-containing protein 2-like isoform X1 [Chiloscyllium plagiosum]|uniref:SURP and G-patch domain-containing protein 2-like isoform X1 n=1 Tax=Chiloscyllium plagiosum TaxID=36176 RepID=UPI001CB7B765|nr:SURP and G-patch domain-containing protein 2-like isoform X1 [Chiloscyllium plagiosum]
MKYRLQLFIKHCFNFNKRAKHFFSSFLPLSAIEEMLNYAPRRYPRESYEENTQYDGLPYGDYESPSHRSERWRNMSSQAEMPSEDHRRYYDDASYSSSSRENFLDHHERDDRRSQYNNLRGPIEPSGDPGPFGRSVNSNDSPSMRGSGMYRRSVSPVESRDRSGSYRRQTSPNNWQSQSSVNDSRDYQFYRRSQSPSGRDGLNVYNRSQNPVDTAGHSETHRRSWTPGNETRDQGSNPRSRSPVKAPDAELYKLLSNVIDNARRMAASKNDPSHTSWRDPSRDCSQMDSSIYQSTTSTDGFHAAEDYNPRLNQRSSLRKNIEASRRGPSFPKVPPKNTKGPLLKRPKVQGRHGLLGRAPGLLGRAPGLLGTAPGLLGAAPGLLGAAPGLLGTAPGLLGTAPGLLGTAPAGLVGSSVSSMPVTTYENVSSDSSVHLYSLGNMSALGSQMELGQQIIKWADFHSVAVDHSTKKKFDPNTDTYSKVATAFQCLMAKQHHDICDSTLVAHLGLTYPVIDNSFVSLLIRKNVITSRLELDDIVHQEESLLQEIQSKLLECIGPLLVVSSNHEQSSKSQSSQAPNEIASELEHAVTACRQAMVFIGQIFAFVSEERRKNLLRKTGLISVAPKYDYFVNLESNQLFGNKYTNELKNRVEQIYLPPLHSQVSCSSKFVSKVDEQSKKDAAIKPSKTSSLADAKASKQPETVSSAPDNSNEQKTTPTDDIDQSMAEKGAPSTADESVHPPEDSQVKTIIDKLAMFVAEKGEAAEKAVIQHKKEDFKYGFLLDPKSNEYKYYKQKVAQFSKENTCQSGIPAAVENEGSECNTSTDNTSSGLQAEFLTEVESSATCSTAEEGDSLSDTKTKTTAEKLAKFVAECGPDLEEIAIENNRDNPTFWFLYDENSSYYKYYKEKVKEYSGMIEKSDTSMDPAPEGASLGRSVLPRKRKGLTLKVGMLPPKKIRPKAASSPVRELKRIGYDKPTYKPKKKTKSEDLNYTKNKLAVDNVGYKMLQRMGWKDGEGLGSEKQGIRDPVNRGVTSTDRSGLGVGGTAEKDEVDNEFAIFRKRMMVAFRSKLLSKS